MMVKNVRDVTNGVKESKQVWILCVDVHLKTINVLNNACLDNANRVA